MSLQKEDHFENLKMSHLRQEMTRNGLELKSPESGMVKGGSLVALPNS